MRNPAAIVLVLAAAATATGCAGLRQAVGVEKVAPDEFRVVTKAPLVIPPDYALRPPRPGDPRPQELRPDVEAAVAVFGRDIGQRASLGEQALVVRAGAEAVDPKIRNQVDLEGGDIVRKPESFADAVIGAPSGEQVQNADEAAESVRRVTGGAPVVIERKNTRSKLPGT